MAARRLALPPGRVGRVALVAFAVAFGWAEGELRAASTAACLPPLLCVSRQFQREDLSPPKNLYGVSIAGPGDAWAVGESGTILHRSSRGWEQINSGTTADLISVWSRGNDVWIVARDGLLHRSETDFVRVALPSAAAIVFANGIDQVTATGSSDVWFGGAGGILHFDGARWTADASIPVDRLMPRVPGEVWANERLPPIVPYGALKGRVLYRDGWQTWREKFAPAPVDGRLGTFAPIGPGDAWASTSICLFGSHCSSSCSTDLSRYVNGALDSQLRSSSPISRFVGTRSDDLWAVADDGLKRFDGSSWTDIPGSPSAATDAAGADGMLILVGLAGLIVTCQ